MINIAYYRYIINYKKMSLYLTLLISFFSLSNNIFYQPALLFILNQNPFLSNTNLKKDLFTEKKNQLPID